MGVNSVVNIDKMYNFNLFLKIIFIKFSEKLEIFMFSIKINARVSCKRILSWVLDFIWYLSRNSAMDINKVVIDTIMLHDMFIYPLVF